MHVRTATGDAEPAVGSGSAAAPGVDAAPEERETSGATTGVLIRYVRERAGDAGVAEVLRRAGVAHDAAELTDPTRWWSYDTRIRLFAATTEVLADPDAMFKVGAAALENGMGHALVLLIRAMGSPRQVIRQLPRAVQKFSTTSTMRILEAGTTSAVIDYRLHEGYAHSRLDCRYAQGLLTNVPTVFGLPRAEIVHDECESDGHPACIYRLSWERHSRWRRGRADRSAAGLELQSLRGQLRVLQSAATELVAADDVDTVLDRVVARAAEAVMAPAHLLAVRPHEGVPPLVHSAGLPTDRAAELAAALLERGQLGPEAVVVEVASARRSYGWLAALYRPGDEAIGDETDLLAAYAGHAAASLDLVLALDDARREADRASALLKLAHELATAPDADAVARIVAEALPGIVGSTTAGILLWEAASGSLRLHSSVGYAEDRRLLLAQTPIRPGDVPELTGMLTDKEPRILSSRDCSPVLAALLQALGTSDVAAVPLLAGTTFIGVATTGWPAGQAPEQMAGEVVARLRGVGDQAASALQKAQLLETVRHQATHDALTGLPNRVLFLDRLERALLDVRPEEHLGVLFCDLDRFKQVNDTLGHAAGDELLRQVAARLRATVRPEDTVGRLSGDEFAVILPGLAAPADAQRLAGRVTGCFEQPFRLEGQDVHVVTSVGIAVLADGRARSAEQLLREADAAMYRHKQRVDRRAAAAVPR